jgi:hypothetical protein
MQAFADAQALPTVLHERPGHLMLSRAHMASADALELVLLRSEPLSSSEDAEAEALLLEALNQGQQPHAQPAAVAVHGESGEEGSSSSGPPSLAAADGEEPDQAALAERRQRNLAGQPGTRDSSSSIAEDIKAAHGQKDGHKQPLNGHSHASGMPLQIRLESNGGTEYHSTPHPGTAQWQQKPKQGALATRFAALPWAQVGAPDLFSQLTAR